MLVVPGLFMAEMSRGGRVYLLADGSTCVLVDTGAPDGTLGAGQVIEEAGRTPHEVRLILLTHAHPGHAGNASGLRVLTGAPVAASAAVAEALRSPPAPARRRWLRRPPAQEPVRIDRLLEPGESIDLAGGVEVLDAPGHAPGSLAFLLRGPEALCVGDAGQVGPHGLRPPPKGRSADPEAAARTVDRLGALTVRVLAPGHGYASVDGRLPVSRRG